MPQPRQTIINLISGGQPVLCSRTGEVWSRVDQIPSTDVWTDDYCDLVASAVTTGGPTSAQIAQQIQDAITMYKRSQPSNVNRGTWNVATAYSYGDIVQSGSPASSYSLLNTAGLTGGGGPGVDSGNWGLFAAAGGTGATGASASALDSTATYTTAQTPIPSPAAGQVTLEVTYGNAATGAIADRMCPRQTGLRQVVVKNETSFNVTISPPTGGSFDSGQLASYLIASGDAATFTADPASATSWEAS